MVLAAQALSHFKTEEKQNFGICKHYNRVGHLLCSCFVIVGYQEWWGDTAHGRSYIKSSPIHFRGISNSIPFFSL